VLDAVAGEDVDLPVGEPHRDLDLHLAIGGAQHGADVVSSPIRSQARSNQWLTIS
jgi:hypothetical protein